jgi:hypothetical protein
LQLGKKLGYIKKAQEDDSKGQQTKGGAHE